MINAATNVCGACRLPASTVSSEQSAWSEHPRYPAQTLLLGSHRNFRNISDRLVKDGEQLLAAAEHEPADVRASRWLFEAWMSAMSGHEHYEENKLYRYLVHRFGGSFDCLQDQHHALHQARDQVRDAYAKADLVALTGALRHHRNLLYAHLEQEEGVVIPLLLQLQPEEFERYYRMPISLLLS